MKVRLATWWETLRASYWLIPTCTSIAVFALAWLTTLLDRKLHALGTLPDWLYSGGPEGARQVLSTLASAMMSVTSVVFSITIVALTLASNQFGPRLLRNYMKDRGSQWTLGVFIATFLYALLILRTVRDGDSAFVPGLGVTCALVLALLSTGVLIYFIHHISTLIQADQVVRAVHDELCDVIGRLFPGEVGAQSKTSGSPRLPEDFERNAKPLTLPVGDYLEGIDEDDLLRLAEENDLVLRLRKRPGDFIPRNGTVADVWPGEKLTDRLAGRLRATFVLGPCRTPTQDVEFGVLQLAEIAVRSLSPGMNDPFTAMACVDRLGSALRELCRNPFPATERVDSQNKLRIVADVTDFEGHVGAAFNQIRQNARGSVAVLIRLLEALGDIAEVARQRSHLDVLRRHADMLLAAAGRDVPEPADREAVAERHRRVLAVIADRASLR